MEIEEDIKMTPRAMSVVTQAINEVNQKVLAENREDALAEGRAEGRAEGLSEGLVKGEFKAMEKFALAFRDKVDLNELSEVTGLTIDEIKRL